LATEASAELLPLALLLAALSRLSGCLVERQGARLPLVAGPIVAACGFALFAVPGIGGSYWLTFFPAVVILGLGLGITVAPLTTIVMNAAPADLVGAASGINNAASRLAGLLAVAALGIIIVPIFERSLHGNLAGTGIAPSVIEVLERQRDRLGAIDVPPTLDVHTRSVVEHAIAGAFVDGFRAVMLVCAALALAGAAGAWLTVKDVRPDHSPPS